MQYDSNKVSANLTTDTKNSLESNLLEIFKHQEKNDEETIQKIKVCRNF